MDFFINILLMYEIVRRILRNELNLVKTITELSIAHLGFMPMGEVALLYATISFFVPSAPFGDAARFIAFLFVLFSMSAAAFWTLIGVYVLVIVIGIVVVARNPELQKQIQQQKQQQAGQKPAPRQPQNEPPSSTESGEEGEEEQGEQGENKIDEARETVVGSSYMVSDAKTVCNFTALGVCWLLDNTFAGKVVKRIV